MPGAIERWTKRAVAASTLAALIFETVLAGRDIQRLPLIALVTAVAGLIAGRRGSNRAMGIVFACGYLVPAAFFVVHGHFRPWYLTPWKTALTGIAATSFEWRWECPRRLRFALVAWALAVAASWPFVALRELDWMPWLLWTRPSTPSSPFNSIPNVVWIAQIAQVHLFGLLFVDWLFGRLRHEPARVFESDVIRPALLTVAVGAVLAIYQGFVDLRFLNMSPWPEIGRASGALADANASGALLGLWIAVPAALAATVRSRATAVVLVATSALLLLGVWTTASRTGLFIAVIGIAAAVHIFFGARASGPRSANRNVYVALVVLIIGVAAVGLLLLLRKPSVENPILRARSLLPNLSAAALRNASWELLWARNGYGLIAARMIKEDPIGGVGVGAFHNLSVEYARKVTGGFLPGDNAQSWYRHQLAELGLLGSVGWIVWVVLVIALIVRGRPSVDQRPTVLALKYSLVAFGLASMLGMPSQNLLVALTVWLFVFWLWTSCDTPLDIDATDRRLLGALALAGGLIGVTFYSGWHDLRPPFRAKRYDNGYRYGWYVPFDGAAGETRTEDHAVAVPQAPRPWLKLTTWVEHPDANERPVLAQIWVDGGSVLRKRLPGRIPSVDYVRVPGGNNRFVLETRVDRTFRPDQRSGQVGLNIAWQFVDHPGVR